MSLLKSITDNLPEVQSPSQKKLPFNERVKWTLLILAIFFILGLIPLFGLGQNQLQQFEFLSVILGAEFGSLISLGIGPLVTASIVLQLLNGSGIVKFDLTKPEGKKNFHATQKLMGIFFVIFEAAIYVFMGGLAPSADFVGGQYLLLQILLVTQLTLGGLLIMFMDEVVSKWGFGSGISLFIAAGVSKSVFVRAFSPLASPTNPNIASGAVPALFQSLASGDPVTALLMIASIISTLLVFGMAVYAQSMKIEIPLSFGRVRGYGIRWPLSFIYTSNIPVILAAALIANLQLWARLLQNWGFPLLGTFVGNSPASGAVYWLNAPNLIGTFIKQGTFLIGWDAFGQTICYLLFMVFFCVLFSIFWVQTSGMDARAQAKNILASGLQIPGFRKDERILEKILNRYIQPLTVMGAIAVGILAAAADLSGALANGTGLLLTVMIIYRLYEDISKHYMMDMNPMMRKFMGGQ